MMIFLDNLINGLSLGSIYAIIALGYTMVYGIAKMLNFAHGDVIMVGAYIAFCGLQYWNLPPVLAILLAMVVCTLLGVSPRGMLAMLRAAQALAMTEGREHVIPDDIQRLAVPVWAHRVIPRGFGDAGSLSRQIVLDAVRDTPAPTETR